MPRSTITLRSPEETTRFAARLASHLVAGDVLLLDGPIGAGKSHFARSLIHALQDVPEDVPSPTFTLVQTYETRAGEVWHADLYRLTDPSELDELGLSDAMETAICLIEWPDRLGPLTPPNALWLRFSPDPDAPDTRFLTLDGPSDRLDCLLEALPT